MNSKLRGHLEELALEVGITTTRDYKLKHGLWEGLSVDHVGAINAAEKAIRQAVGEEVLELLGDDEINYMQRPPILNAVANSPHEIEDVIELNQRIAEDTAKYHRAVHRYELRAKLRQKIKAWSKEE